MELVMKHCETGYEMLRSYPPLTKEAAAVHAHHEQYDGSGYPLGLKGDQIPLLARIVCLADSFEVISHGRVYQEAMTIEEACQEIRDSSGTHFDPMVVKAFEACHEELAAIP